VASRRRLTWVDVFTSTPLHGNGLAVVHDADDLDDATMLRVARETNLSETTFVQSAPEPDVDYCNRIWTILEEIRFAGHPSLGTAVAHARARGETAAHYVQQTIAGRQPIEVELASQTARASMLMAPAQFGEPVEPGPVLGALGLGPADAHPELPVQPVSCGIFHLMVPVRDGVALARARPSLSRVETIVHDTGTMVLYAFVPETGDHSVRARGFFATPDRVLEDPATGSAAGPLSAYLDHHAATSTVTISQGVEMGRPSRLEAAVGPDGVRVGGECVVVLEGELVI
jgi:trans-2,3-dihydro-3-hydroxyanthranilate isomerase